MTEWIKELSLLAEVEYRARRILGTLATVGTDGLPSARTVIVRDLDERDGTIWITSDGRSRKIRDLEFQPRAELVFWAPHERQQFRVRGAVEILRAGKMRQDTWEQLNDSGRAMFFWPEPGQVRQAGAEFRAAAGAEIPPPASFVVLALRPAEVEALELNEAPHRRRRWRAVNNWSMELLNP